MRLVERYIEDTMMQAPMYAERTNEVKKTLRNLLE